MNQNEFETSIPGAIVMTDDELIHTHGGGFLGDAWDAVKGAASAVGDALGSAIDWIRDHVHLPTPCPLPKPRPAPPPCRCPGGPFRY
ncbi:MAG TPA: hypothetical protein VFS67_36465 [Polyangiaceae bacterium]|jgi:hypothetical protein|nr:hypothetical protein [Polyangiaceae bacterium]